MAEEEIQVSEKSTKLKTIITVAGILVVEAVVIVGAMSLVGGPDEVKADGALDATVTAEEEKIVEVLVLDAKLPNNKTGVTYIYDTEIYVQVKQKHADRVSAELDQFQNEIKAEISAIWRTSEPQHFQEPRLENLTRKVGALLEQRFGADEDSGDGVVSKCVIVMGTGFRIG